MFKWVSPGVYDYEAFQCRYVIAEGGRPTTTISKMWLDQGGPQGIDPSLNLPWGTYPDFPPKPPKKL